MERRTKAQVNVTGHSAIGRNLGCAAHAFGKPAGQSTRKSQAVDSESKESCCIEKSGKNYRPAGLLSLPEA